MSSPPPLQGDMLADSFTLKVTAEQLAELFGVSRPRIYQFRDDGMPMEARNQFDAGDCIKWRLQRAEDKAASPANEETSRSALNIAQREKVELEIAKARGLLLPASGVTELLNTIAAILATHLDGVAPRVAAKVVIMDDAADAQRLLFNEHRDIRKNIATAIQTYAREAAANLEGLKPLPAKRKRKARRAAAKKPKPKPAHAAAAMSDGA